MAERLGRKFALLFGCSCEGEGLGTELSQASLRPKVLIYAAHFAEQYIELGQHDTAATLLEVLLNARKGAGLPDERRLLALRASALKSRVEALKAECRQLKLSHGTPRHSISAAEGEYRDALKALREAEAAVQGHPSVAVQSFSQLSLSASGDVHPRPRTLDASQACTPLMERQHSPQLGASTRATALSCGATSAPTRIREPTPQMSQGSSSSWATPVRGVRFSTDSEGGRHMTASLLTRTPSCVSNGRSKHNLAISPASCAVLPHSITPQTGPTTHSPGSFSLGRTKQFGAASPAKEVHGSAQCPTTNVRSWNAQLTAWKQQSSQLRQDAEKMLATMPSHCRIGASTTITTTANDSSDLWVYRHLLFHEGLFAETSDKAAMFGRPLTTPLSLKLTFENVEKTDVLIKFSVFDETIPYSVSLLREAIRSSPSPSVVSMSATCLVLELSTAIPGSIHPDEEKLATERARLPHDAQHLVSLRPSGSNSRLALAFTADIRAPFGHDGVVVGRLQNGFDFLEGVAGAALILEDIHVRFSTSD